MNPFHTEQRVILAIEMLIAQEIKDVQLGENKVIVLLEEPFNPKQLKLEL